MKIRVLVRDDGIIFDFDGFRGKSCVEEFEKLIRILKNAGIDVEIWEMKLKAGVSDASDLRERG